ncbi:MAG: SoxR reducing system RseC family protein [Candidatus Thiodiazotropha sp.]
MIEETARVVRVDGGFAVVETQQQAACGSCQSAGSCSTSVLSGLFKRHDNEMRVLNTLDVHPGERVIIGVQERALVKLSLLAYLMPLVGLIAGAIVADLWVRSLLMLHGELPQIFGGLSGLAGGFWILRQFSKAQHTNPEYQAVILRRTGQTKIGFS